MNKSMKFHICTHPIQNDTGANENVTCIKSIIHNYVDIDPYPIGGVKADEVAIRCTGKGDLPWMSKEGVCLMIPILFSEEVEGTIVSPTTVVQHHRANYKGFTIVADCNNGTGTLNLVNRNPVLSISYHMNLRNGLWFHEYLPTNTPNSKINKLNDA